MLTFPSALRVFLAVEPVDMRQQFNGLWAQAEQNLQENPRLGAVFVFTNKDRNRLKMLHCARRTPLQTVGGGPPGLCPARRAGVCALCH